MKTFQDFTAHLANDPTVINQIADRAQCLTTEQAADVVRLLLAVLKEYDEFRCQ